MKNKKVGAYPLVAMLFFAGLSLHGMDERDDQKKENKGLLEKAEGFLTKSTGGSRSIYKTRDQKVEFYEKLQWMVYDYESYCECSEEEGRNQKLSRCN